MKLLFAAILFIACSPSIAQKYADTHNPKDDKIKSLLSKENDINGFGAVDLKVSEFLGERSLIVGAYGGLVVNRRYLFGIAGYGITTNLEIEGMVQEGSTNKNLNLHGGYGGIIFGPTIAPNELIHLSFPIVFGAGSFEIVDENFFPLPTDTDFTVENTIFFVIEPGVQLEFNITEYFRLAIGGSYRYISGTDLINLVDEDVSGFSGIISFRFGRF